MISTTPRTHAQQLPAVRRSGRALAASNGLSLPGFGADVLGLSALALLALFVFEGAAWLAAAPLATLVYFVAFAPALLFLVAVFSERQR